MCTMNDKLTPLTPAQQEEFNRRRVSAVVVQTKCEGCGKWYESDRKPQAYTESFFCDCGHFLQYGVPAVELRTRQEPIDPDAVLDTGMKAAEVLTRAAMWWEKTGHKLMAQLIRE